MNKCRMIVVLLFFLFILSFIPMRTQASGSGDYPPPVNGDWNITVDTVVENETILLKGNLTVEYGVSLTFRNVTLIMDSEVGGATMDDYYHIEVKRGGTMKIFDVDGDNTTTSDASNITLNDTAAYYWFWVREGSNFTMRNSELHHCGGASVSLGGAGLMLYTDNATIDRNLISDNREGVVCYNSDAIISNNTIENNEVAGIFATVWSNGTIENNRLVGNSDYGVWVDGWSNSNPQPSNPLVRTNYIENSGQGIHITVYSIPDIRDNIILNSGEDGIYCGQWCQVTIRNTTIDGANYGIASSSARYVSIINCTVLNVGPNYDLSVGSATYFTTINTTFDKSNVGFLNTNANLTVCWYLHTYVEDSVGSPITCATVRIRDNTNGTYDENFTTGSNGYRRWTVLTEYWQNSTIRIDYTPHNITVNYSGLTFINNPRDSNMNESKTEVFTATTPIPEFSMLLLPVLFILLINIIRRFYTSGR